MAATSSPSTPRSSTCRRRTAASSPASATARSRPEWRTHPASPAVRWRSSASAAPSSPRTRASGSSRSRPGRSRRRSRTPASTSATSTGCAPTGSTTRSRPTSWPRRMGIQSLSFYVDQFYGGSVSLTMLGQATHGAGRRRRRLRRGLPGPERSVGCPAERLRRAAVAGRLPWDMQFKVSAGVIAPSQEIAMAARAHMLKHGTTSEDFGRIAILSRTQRPRQRAGDDAHADDDGGLPGQPVDRRAVPQVRLLPRDRRRGRRRPRPRRSGRRPAAPPGARPGRGVGRRASTWSTTATTTSPASPARPIAERLYAAAGLGPPDIDFAELYDCFTYNVLSQIEGYGFAEPGGVPAMLADGAFDRATGSLPLNTHGGLLVRGLHPRHEPRVRGRRAGSGRRRRTARSSVTTSPSSPASWATSAATRPLRCWWAPDGRPSRCPDRDTAPYWAALADGRFEVQHCRACHRWTWPARPICSGCHGDDLAWEEPAGTGEGLQLGGDPPAVRARPRRPRPVHGRCSSASTSRTTSSSPVACSATSRCTRASGSGPRPSGCPTRSACSAGRRSHEALDLRVPRPRDRR